MIIALKFNMTIIVLKTNKLPVQVYLDLRVYENETLRVHLEITRKRA